MKSKSVSKKLKVIVFNVGQGDHILIEFPNGNFGLVDFYFCDQVNWPSDLPVITYLESNYPHLSKYTFEFVHLTHYHLDHILGLPYFLLWAKSKAIVKEFWWPGAPAKEEIIKELNTHFSRYIKVPRNRKKSDILVQVEAAKSTISNLHKQLPSNAKAKYIASHHVLANISSIEVRCLSPGLDKIIDFFKRSTTFIVESMINKKGVIAPMKEDMNKISTILSLNYNNSLRLFLGGDAPLSNIRNAIRDSEKVKYPIGNHFIKVSHHGSKKSSSRSIWRSIATMNERVDIAISAGSKNIYGHPDQETMDHIRAIQLVNKAIKVYCTNQPDSHDCDIEPILWPKFSEESQRSVSKSKADLAGLGQEATISGENRKNMFIGYSFTYDLSPTSADLVSVRKMIAE